MAPLRPTYLQMPNISPCRCLNPLRFLVFNSETAEELVSQANPHVALRKTVTQLPSRKTQSQLREFGISAKYLMEMFPSPT